MGDAAGRGLPHLEAPHRWDLTPAEARAVQVALRSRVVRRDDLPGGGDPIRHLRRVAGVDAGFPRAGRRGTQRLVRAAVAVLSFPDLEPLEEAVAEQPVEFPYISGLLSFRELPAVLAALGKLSTAPDLLLCDAHGVAHPRRFGLACHLGVLTGLASIGAAKSRLVGKHEEVPQEKGAWRPLVVRKADGEEVIGAVVRSRSGVRPVYVSIGHRVSLETAIRVVLRCSPRYRIAEPLRRADRLASRAEPGSANRSSGPRPERGATGAQK
jgi:deoxyribonuclease V